MPSRTSIEYLLAPTAATPTLCNETEAFQEDIIGPHTPPTGAMSPSIDFQRHQADMDQYSDTRGHATSACSLLSPAKLTSSGQPTLNDMVSVYTQQSPSVTFSSMTLQEQMFSGYYNAGSGLSAQMCPICLHIAFMNPCFLRSMCGQQYFEVPSAAVYDPAFLHASHDCYCGWCAGCGICAFKPAEHSIPSGSYTESSHLQTGFTDGYLTNAADSSHAIYDGPLSPSVYDLDGQPISQQGFVLGNVDDGGAVGENVRPTTLPVSVFPEQITAWKD
ncbi:uncharacterized protein BDZ83DRAFT_105377 [Colletotrichum acutatum]|uniref:Uncharacterized protein n=1 Tax=Glomerella acutata TaxID=27357 RepID=A0AAD8UD38_GLOAC|nr:uncharacterized protein BDZ83DRAFT_105377 [Colletotrichum acutatum]KAK1712243.1 hypothetical protein BDZ83DRAFT_105377 [Colletotrichum acutatum]